MILLTLRDSLNRFSKWFSLIGRTTLLAKGMHYVRKTYRICDMHFSDDAKFESHYNRGCLKVDCVSSQYLPRLDESIQGTEEVNNLPATSTQGLDSIERSAELTTYFTCFTNTRAS
ncbi:hypothetical protein QE152_g1955 [Popillia japonica]|uniref:THAP-type domain-containing protein n=1 Tax=Popillia japonica TaxID=7064 RepID=A0AAW1N385_POPJA